MQDAASVNEDEQFRLWADRLVDHVMFRGDWAARVTGDEHAAGIIFLRYVSLAALEKCVLALDETTATRKRSGKGMKVKHIHGILCKHSTFFDAATLSAFVQTRANNDKVLLRMASLASELVPTDRRLINVEMVPSDKAGGVLLDSTIVPMRRTATQTAKHPACKACTNTENLRQCSRCKAVSYCSPACQQAHWSTHKTLCVQTT